MLSDSYVTQRRSHNFVCFVPALLLALALLGPTANAQDQAQAAPAKPAEARPNPEIHQTFYLTNTTNQQGLNDIQTALRNALPKARVFGVASQNAIQVHGTPEEVQLAQRLLADLDRPKKVYRLTYKINETEHGQPKDKQQFTLIVASGDRTVFKQGDRVPIVTGKSREGSAPQSSEVQYVDVGLSIDASLTASADAITLRTKFETSRVTDQATGAGARDPDIRQTVLDETAALVPGKPLVLGSLDIPGTTRHQEIEVVAEPVQ
jgi:type II secretory pathway component GspD/PulD (secretin)